MSSWKDTSKHWSKTSKRDEVLSKVAKFLQPNYWKGKNRPEMIGNKFAEGTTHTEEWKQQASLRSKGNKYRVGKTPWNKGKHFLAISGENNPNWKGGVSKTTKTDRQLHMETLEYKNWRVSVFRRDNYTCQKCGITGVRLNANHDLPYNLFPDLRVELLNGETLCESCHVKTTKMQRMFAVS